MYSVKHIEQNKGTVRFAYAFINHPGNSWMIIDIAIALLDSLSVREFSGSITRWIGIRCILYCNRLSSYNAVSKEVNL